MLSATGVAHWNWIPTEEPVPMAKSESKTQRVGCPSHRKEIPKDPDAQDILL